MSTTQLRVPGLNVGPSRSRASTSLRWSQPLRSMSRQDCPNAARLKPVRGARPLTGSRSRAAAAVPGAGGAVPVVGSPQVIATWLHPAAARTATRMVAVHRTRAHRLRANGPPSRRASSGPNSARPPAAGQRSAPRQVAGEGHRLSSAPAGRIRIVASAGLARSARRMVAAVVAGGLVLAAVLAPGAIGFGELTAGAAERAGPRRRRRCRTRPGCRWSARSWTGTGRRSPSSTTSTGCRSGSTRSPSRWTPPSWPSRTAGSSTRRPSTRRGCCGRC